MKKYFQIFVVIALVLTVVGIASNNPAWASSLTAPFRSAQLTKVDVTASGSYLVGGICRIDIAYKGTGLKDTLDAEVPVTESKKVPFGGQGELYYPGCHIVHFKADKIVNEASADDGTWKVCFAQRPDIQMVIYYYLDTPVSGSRVWAALPTVVENGFACATAPYTGVYMPAGIVQNQPGGVDNAGIQPPPQPQPQPGTVKAPPPNINQITKSGSYGVGGICTLIVDYKVANLTDDFYVELPIRDDKTIPFPNNGDILYLPGCHVLHFELSQLQKSMSTDKGSWKICFAAQPNKTMTIYFYQSLVHKDLQEDVFPSWTPLPTTMENGMACAPAQNTGVYAPAGH